MKTYCPVRPRNRFRSRSMCAGVNAIQSTTTSNDAPTAQNITRLAGQGLRRAGAVVHVQGQRLDAGRQQRRTAAARGQGEVDAALRRQLGTRGGGESGAEQENTA